jgi:hypothetical protein
MAIKFSKLVPPSVFAVALITVIGGIFLVRQGTEPQPTLSSTLTPTRAPSEEGLVVNEVLEAVSFCGETYRARQIYINGVNLVQRISAEFAAYEGTYASSCERIVRGAENWVINTKIEKIAYPERGTVNRCVNKGQAAAT